MTLISKRFAEELNEKEMRDAFLAAQTRTYLAYQIKAIRSQRGWSQEDFARVLETSQSAVSRMEDRQYGKLNLQTLFEAASAFNCGLVVQFVPYADFLARTSNLAPDNMKVSEFSADSLNSLYQGGAAANNIPTVNTVPTQEDPWKKIIDVVSRVNSRTYQDQISGINLYDARALNLLDYEFLDDSGLEGGDAPPQIEWQGPLDLQYRTTELVPYENHRIT